MTMLVFVFMIILHDPNGLTISVNPSEIATLRETRGKDATLIHESVRCVVGMSNGKWVSVVEPCDQIREAMKQAGN